MLLRSCIVGLSLRKGFALQYQTAVLAARSGFVNPHKTAIVERVRPPVIRAGRRVTAPFLDERGGRVLNYSVVRNDSLGCVKIFMHQRSFVWTRCNVAVIDDVCMYVSTVSVEVSIVDQSGREDTTIIGRRETEQGGGHHRLLLLARIIFWP